MLSLTMGIRIFFIVLFFPASLSLHAQEADLVRLDYDRASVKASQIGMAVSPDGKQIAFAYNDQTIKIFDVAINRFVKKRAARRGRCSGAASAGRGRA